MSGETVESSSVAARAVVGLTPSMMADQRRERDVWTARLRAAGIDPDRLSQWTPGPLPDESVDAIYELAGRGGRFVLTRLHRGESRPRPCWQDWTDAQPRAERVVQHLRDGGLIGIVPASLSASALDVDQGDPAALVQEYPPLALLPATRGSHAYYVDAQAGDRRSGPFRSVRFGVAGDVIAGPRSFLRLDHDEHNVVELAERIVFGPDRWFFPDNRLPTFAEVEQGILFHPLHPLHPRYSPAPSTRTPGTPPVAAPSVAQATIGTRNNALFLALHQWALPRETGHSRADWERAVVEQARALNATMRDPLADYEVAATGRSVAGWRWGLPASAHAAAFRALQAERGRAGHGESKAKGGRAGKRKADPASARSTRPWEAAGVSRATWYRRKKGALRPDNNLYQGGPFRAPAEPAA